MKLLKIIILLCLSISLAFSQEQFERILITKTTKKNNLLEIKNKLNRVGIQMMYIQNLQNGYYVYSKIFTNTQNAQSTLSKIKLSLPHAKIVSIDLQKKEIITQEINEETLEDTLIASEIFTEVEDDIQQNNKIFYINLALGYTNTNGSTNDLSSSKLSNSGLSYALEGGYEFYDGLSVSLAYLDTSTSDITMFNIYGAINYRYHIIDEFSIGGGLILGVSSLEIDSYSSSTASINLLYGYDLAVFYEIIDNFDIYTKYQGLYKDHVINIDNTTDIEFDYTHNYLVGIGYKFSL